MVLWLYAITLFVSAFLLFLVQPMIGKMILPNLGGTPQVWNTCMVFFQTALLAGYAYTHTISTRAKLRAQLMIHGVLLFVPLLLLFGLGDFRSRTVDWFPEPGANPILATLGLLTLVVGLPFFVVATTAPLLQRWFSYSGHPAAKDPYFLYGASNIGSFASLIAYPFLIEPLMALGDQSGLWAGGYVALLALVLMCAGLVWQSPETVGLPQKDIKEDRPAPAPAPEPEKEATKETGFKASSKTTGGFKKGGKPGFKKGGMKPTFKKEEPRSSVTMTAAPSVKLDDDVTPLRRLRWIGLAAVPSSMMLGVTTYITTDLSPIPLLWLIPLALYLLTFVLVFTRKPIVWTDLPHTIAVWVQPFALILLIPSVALGASFGNMFMTIAVHITAFLITTLVCHGELAKDRPSTKHLTEFYLLMSVGGMVGGMFNALIAPLFFPSVWEYSLAIFFAALLRPRLVEGDWLDEIFESFFSGGNKERGSASTGLLLDIVLPLVVLVVAGGLALARTPLTTMLGSSVGFYVVFCLVTLVLCIFLLSRPIRFGLAIGAVLLVLTMSETRGGEDIIYRDRSYFGILQVKLETNPDRGSGEYADGSKDRPPYTTLIHGHINHGMCFLRPTSPDDWGDPEKDFTRLPTTYYHPKGPAGVVMQRYNWFARGIDSIGDPEWMKKDNNTWADNRMPASLVGLSAMNLPMSLPAEALVDLWSEPPFATIGLGTGTMAAYARPFQHMHYYEIDNKVLNLSIKPSGNPKLARTPPSSWYQSELYADAPYFTYLRDAKLRGAELWVMMGDARQRMKREYGWKESEDVSTYRENPFGILVIDGQEYIENSDGTRIDLNGGPDNFYHMMVVDAFSSDAIPAHLITKEAIKMYFEKLIYHEFTNKNGEPDSYGGILAVHTSNRYVDLVRVVADVAKDLGLHSLRGHDSSPYDNPESVKLKNGRSVSDSGHFTSEWVMVARKKEHMDALLQYEPDDYAARDQETKKLKNYQYRAESYWRVPTAYGRYAWDDNYYNVMGVMRDYLRLTGQPE